MKILRNIAKITHYPVVKIKLLYKACITHYRMPLSKCATMLCPRYYYKELLLPVVKMKILLYIA